VRALAKVLAVLVLSAAASPASTLFQGTFATDDQVELFAFTLSSSSLVTIQSYGYAGGTINSTVIPPGGFAPDATIFALVASDYVESTSSNGGNCGMTGTDPVTGNCDDPFIQTTLPAGSYYLALSVWDNVPLTGTLADGYTQTGNPGFTCAEGGSANPNGTFCDVTDALFRSRTGNWALSFTGTTSVQNVTVPEPPTWRPLLWGALTGALFLLLKSARRYGWQEGK
jgi:hypothetical protein